jgi:predicted enzyme related to lactoylglutathione lyase
LEKTAARRARSVTGVVVLTTSQEGIMIRIASAQLWVQDQDEALAFYTQKVGMEIKSDVTVAELGDFRWLTVGPPGQDDVAIVLMAIPGPPVFEQETVDQIKAVMAKGVAGTVFLTTEDCRASYEELRGRGVEFVEEPEERPYGIDAGFRDPSGNHLRLTQVTMAGV